MDLMGGPSNTRACRHPQGRICENLKYGLHQMKIRGQREAYLAVVDSVIVGPEVVRTAEAEDILGINPDLFMRARARKGLTQPFGAPGGDFGSLGGPGPPGGLEAEDSTSEYDPFYAASERGGGGGGGGGGNRRSRLIMSLRDLFVYYARFGDNHSTGQHITLSQSDKWLKQAGVIDNWNITTTDTATYYRKISR